MTTVESENVLLRDKVDTLQKAVNAAGKPGCVAGPRPRMRRTVRIDSPKSVGVGTPPNANGPAEALIRKRWRISSKAMPT